MMMSHLRIHPVPPDCEGRIQHITPATAAWRYVGFDAFQLKEGARLSRSTGDVEQCIVLLSGKAYVKAGALDCGIIGERMSPFDGGPHSVYVPPHTDWTFQAVTECEIGLCSAPAKGEKPPLYLPPGPVEQRGQGTNARFVSNILPDDSPHAESLLVVEVITPGGNWSSYPPHKHDTDNPPHETYLEETYYHRLKRGSGFAIQRVYTDDLTLDETMAVSDRDVVLVPKGYHPVGAPHGFDLYYLNVMAGPVRLWKFTMAPDHAHLVYK
jgi:5-deoxy-glucuronate isomerase